MENLDDWVKARRQALGAGLPQDAQAKWGLALSGGGIRSATFCLGLLKSLAHRDLLLRFDMVSTVSGGGYVGATLGRLFCRARNSDDVKDIANAIRDGEARWFSWWLRANGRYLMPRGARDRLFAMALFLRNLTGVHLELALIALLMGALLGAVDLVGWWGVAQLGYDAPEAFFPVARYLPAWWPVVGFLLLPVVLAGAMLATAYWCVPWLHRHSAVLPYWGLAAAFLALLLDVRGWLATLHGAAGATLRDVLWWTATMLSVCWLAAVPLAAALLQHAPPEGSETYRADSVRNRLTGWLAQCFRVAGMIALAGVVDRLAWFLAFEVQTVRGTGLSLAAAAALLRALLPASAALRPNAVSTRLLLGVGRLLGYGLALLLFAWWVSLLHRAALGSVFQPSGVDFASGWKMLVLLGMPSAVYLLLTGRNFAFLNLSSLHAFYRARLVRSYLGAANGARFSAPAPLGATECVDRTLSPAAVTLKVTERHAEDDIVFADYQPQRHGAPIHLITACVNQTTDPRGGLFNQDRRGLPLVVASGGYMKVAQQDWQAMAPSPLTLGTWTAISGAAVAPGLGSLTRGGISALATFAGLRLGYWWDEATRTGRSSSRIGISTAKSKGLLREMLGAFAGTDGRDWFLTDGGHFENTGAYALLAERAQVVVVADCGADPAYAFNDLENLVRKARIDLQAHILFQRPKTPPPANEAGASEAKLKRFPWFRPMRPAVAWPDAMTAFGSLNDLASSSSWACLAFARIEYHGSRPGHGILVLVKPNLCAGLPVDLVNFKAQNPSFPQQPTADQFFSEAQWESYAQLGCILGSHLSRTFLDELLEHSERYFEADDCTPFELRERQAAKADAPAPNGSRMPSRIAAATTVSTTLSLGAIATVGVSAWQAIDSLRSASAKQTADERAALKELSELWADLPAAAASNAAAAAGSLAAAIARSADTLCPRGEAGWFRSSPLALSIYGAALDACGRLSYGERPPACTLLLEAAAPKLNRPLPDCLLPAPESRGPLPPPRYWVYDYARDADTRSAHPCDGLALERQEAEQANELAHRGELWTQAARLQLRQQVPAECHLLASAPVSPAAAPPAGEPKAAPDAPPVRPVEPEPSPPVPPARLGAKRESASGPCVGKTIYLQVYDGSQMPEAAMYRAAWRKLGAKVPPVEDVSVHARAAGRAAPRAVAISRVRYHDAGSVSCAQALGPAIQQDLPVEPLSPGFAATPGVIEVWLARR